MFSDQNVKEYFQRFFLKEKVSTDDLMVDVRFYLGSGKYNDNPYIKLISAISRQMLFNNNISEKQRLALIHFVLKCETEELKNTVKEKTNE